MYTSAIRRIIPWVLVVALFVPLQAQQPPQIPDTPSGRILNRIIEVFNSGEEERWTDFIKNYWVEREGMFERRLEMFKMTYSDLGGMVLNRIKDSKDYSISALMQAARSGVPDEWFLLSLQIDTLPPYKLDRFSLRPADEPGFEAPEGDLTQQQMIEFLDKYLDNLVSKDRFSGTVLIAKDGKPFYERVYGLACKRYEIPNRIDTKFNLGSMNKMFTGVAIMQLAEQGKVSLRDPVGKYLPDLPRRDIAEKVTIHHLLSHTSGMQDYWDEIFDGYWWEVKTVDQYAKYIFDDSLLFEPGADFHYSNSGPIVLGMIIEKVTGQDYYDYIREHIYQSGRDDQLRLL